jgi:hypothetical protein
MMRAALILVGVGSLFAMERGTPPRVAKAVDQPLTQPTLGVTDSRDTLAKAGRLEIRYFQNELPTQPISFELTPPADSTPVISKEASKIVSGNRHDAETRKIAFLRPKPRPKIPDSKPRPNTRPTATDSNTVADTYRSKAPMDVTPCRPDAFDRFLKALNLRSGCEA